MKKIMITLMALLLFCTACSTGPKYNDGTYTARSEDYDQSGWMDEVTLTVDGGRITEVDWNSYNENGVDKKTLSRNGGYNMVAAGAKSQWHEQAASMEQALIREQDPAKLRITGEGKTDTVSGVSITVSDFIILSAEALKQAK